MATDVTACRVTSEQHVSDDEIAGLWHSIYDIESNKYMLLDKSLRRIKDGKMPSPHLGMAIRFTFPKNDGRSTKKVLKSFIAYYSRFTHGDIPVFEYALKAYRMMNRIFKKLKGFHPTLKLSQVAAASLEVYKLISYHGRPQLTPDEFKEDFAETVNRFASLYNDYADDLDNFIDSIRNGTLPPPSQSAWKRDTEERRVNAASALGRKLDDVGNVIRENRNLTSTAVDNTKYLIAKFDNLRREILHDALTATQRECGKPRRRTRKSKWAECSFHFATHLWDICKNNASYRAKFNHKLHLIDTYNDYRSQLAEHGIATFKDFHAIINACRNRNCRKNSLLA